MFGRASLALLERHFVLAPRQVQGPSDAHVQPAAA
jgi:hypothetical protein